MSNINLFKPSNNHNCATPNIIVALVLKFKWKHFLFYLVLL